MTSPPHKTRAPATACNWNDLDFRNGKDFKMDSLCLRRVFIALLPKTRIHEISPVALVEVAAELQSKKHPASATSAKVMFFTGNLRRLKVSETFEKF
jgi:hypothetical protein